MKTIIAIDLGGSSLRAALVARDGTVVASAQRTHRIAEEADATTWWTMLLEAVAELPAAEVSAIVPTGFTRSQVLVDVSGTPVRLAQCFPDTRATAEAAAMAGAEKGTWVEMTAFHPLARLAWARADAPFAFARARHLLQPKDYLTLRLTGRTAADRISNAWALERRTGRRSLSVFNTAQIDNGLLPDLHDPWDVVGRCTAALPGYEGIPVLCGAMDTWCAALGAGAARPGDAYLIAGTTDAAAPAAAPLIFLPALSGERAPSWAATTRGSFAGLDRAHGPAELARAVLEGVAFADRDLLGGLPFDRLFLAGGGARSDLWCQIRADVLGCQVLRTGDQPGLLGAAMLGWAGIGEFPSLPAAQSAFTATADEFRPDHTVSARTQRLFEAYKQVQAAAALMAHTLSRF